VENASVPTQLIPPPPPRPDEPVVTWRWWEAIVVFLLGSIAAGLIAGPAAAAVDSNKLSDLILALGGEVGIGGTAFLWLWFLHRRSIRRLGVPERPARELGFGALSGLVLYGGGVFVIGSIVISILHGASHHVVRSPRQIPAHLSNAELVLAGVTVIIAAPIAEELVFRGFLFRSIRSRHSFVSAAVVSALLFGAVHYSGGAWQNALLLPIVMCFVGFGLAYVYERRHNILANMAAHATFNVIGFIFIATLNR
jgi:membrane protease YdiL (CAAX protease family)